MANWWVGSVELNMYLVIPITSLLKSIEEIKLMDHSVSLTTRAQNMAVNKKLFLVKSPIVVTNKPADEYHSILEGALRMKTFK
jgi:hypothetical protein